MEPCPIVPEYGLAHHDHGRDATVELMAPELQKAVGTAVLTSCEIQDVEADPVEVTCWGSPSSLR